MENQKIFIDYLAYISDTDNLGNELSIILSVIHENYRDIEFNIFRRMLIEHLNEAIRKKNNELELANSLGTLHLTYDFPFDSKRIKRDLAQVIKTWKYAILYIEEVVNMPSKPKLVLKFDELPDFLNYDEVTELTGWTKKSIQTKHSNLELACVEGTGLTPKQGLLDYYTKRIKGFQVDPEKWFNESLIKKKKVK
ncbi:MAG: hypothetical protein ABFC90_10940 [Bacteroidales bacterium]|nr:hypothetical protein [Bacteroidales bacterium]